jgi:hypothetical protein
LKGDTGIQGIQGLKGDTGSQGIQGLKGDTGSQGIQGLKGDTGIQGIQGLKGDTGIQGIQGLKGDTGSQGIQGLKGDTGSQGIQGLKGDTGSQGIQGKDGLNSTLGAYFVNVGVGTFPIYGGMSDFSSFGMNLFIKGERDSFIIMPYYAVFIFSEINQGGRSLSMGNLSDNIEYYNINGSFRVKSCTLYKWNLGTGSYDIVSTVNNTNAEKTWN